jgi:nucleotide-binding universal stress UspA family protein
MPMAAAWAQALGMTLTIVTVIEDDASALNPDRSNKRYGEHGDAGDYVDHLVEVWRTSDFEVDAEVLSDPIGPASAIRDYLNRRPAGIVALTTHARSGMQRFRMGTVAANIVRASVAPCLVTTVR